MQRILNFFLFFVSCTLLTPGCAEILDPTASRFEQELNPKRDVISCENNEDCQNFIEHSICANMSCKCPADKIESSDRSKCLEHVLGIESKCEDNNQCSETLSTGGVCMEGICKCKEGYHYLKGICWKNIGLGKTCQKNEQCISSYEYIGMECKDNKCQCRHGYYERLGAGCRKKRYLNESCNLDTDCPTERFILCNNMKCVKTSAAKEKTNEIFLNENKEEIEGRRNRSLKCPKGQFEQNGKCVLELGMPCQNHTECSHIPGASCTNEVCACEEVKRVANKSNRKCLISARGKLQNITRSTCQEDEQCAVFGENAFCLNKKCTCKNQTYWDVSENFCWPVKGLGEECQTDKDCHPEETHAQCSGKSAFTTKKCTCMEGYQQKDENCLPYALNIGDKCSVDLDCLVENSYCDKDGTGTCVCNKYYYTEDKKKCIPGVGTPCVTQADCLHLANTTCRKTAKTNLTCQCLDKYAVSDDYSHCLPAVKHQEKCKENFQCVANLGNFGTCANETCQCQKNTHFAKGRCYEDKRLGEKCTTKLQCLSGGKTDLTICLRGYCSCHYDCIENEYGVCEKLANSAAHLSIHPILLTSFLLVFFLKN